MTVDVETDVPEIYVDDASLDIMDDIMDDILSDESDMDGDANIMGADDDNNMGGAGLEIELPPEKVNNAKILSMDSNNNNNNNNAFTPNAKTEYDSPEEEAMAKMRSTSTAGGYDAALNHLAGEPDVDNANPTPGGPTPAGRF